MISSWKKVGTLVLIRAELLEGFNRLFRLFNDSFSDFSKGKNRIGNQTKVGREYYACNNLLLHCEQLNFKPICLHLQEEAFDAFLSH